MTPAAMQLDVVQQNEEVGHLTNEMQSAKSHHLEDAKTYSQQISTDASSASSANISHRAGGSSHFSCGDEAGGERSGTAPCLPQSCQHQQADSHLSGTREWGQAGTVDSRAM